MCFLPPRSATTARGRHAWPHCNSSAAPNRDRPPAPRPDRSRPGHGASQSCVRFCRLATAFGSARPDDVTVRHAWCDGRVWRFAARLRRERTAPSPRHGGCPLVAAHARRGLPLPHTSARRPNDPEHQHRSLLSCMHCCILRCCALFCLLCPSGTVSVACVCGATSRRSATRTHARTFPLSTPRSRCPVRRRRRVSPCCAAAFVLCCSDAHPSLLLSSVPRGTCCAGGVVLGVRSRATCHPRRLLVSACSSHTATAPALVMCVSKHAVSPRAHALGSTASAVRGRLPAHHQPAHRRPAGPVPSVSLDPTPQATSNTPRCADPHRPPVIPPLRHTPAVVGAPKLFTCGLCSVGRSGALTAPSAGADAWTRRRLNCITHMGLCCRLPSQGLNHSPLSAPQSPKQSTDSARVPAARMLRLFPCPLCGAGASPGGSAPTLTSRLLLFPSAKLVSTRNSALNSCLLSPRPGRVSSRWCSGTPTRGVSATPSECRHAQTPRAAEPSPEPHALSIDNKAARLSAFLSVAVRSVCVLLFLSLSRFLHSLPRRLPLFFLSF